MSQLSNTQDILLTALNLLREEYMDDAPELTFRHGRVTDRLFRPAGQAVNGDGITQQVISGRTDSARASRDPMKDFGHQRPLSAKKVKFRFSEDDVTQNDFTSLDVVAEIPHLATIRGDVEEAAIDIADTVRRQFMENAQDSWPLLLHANANGRVALVNGARKAADNTYYDGCSAASGGETTVRVRVDGGSIAPFEPGTRWSFYSAAGALLADECEVTHKNPVDNSFECKLTTTGPNQSTVANMDSIADDAEIFRSGERGSGMRSSLTEWFANPSSGENFIGGSDRTTSDYRWLLPTQSRLGEVSASIRRDFLDDAALAMSYVMEEGQSLVAVAHTSLVQTLRRSIGEDVLNTQGASDDGQYTFGELGVSFQHPHLGKVTILGDPLAPIDDLKLLTPEHWLKFHYGFNGFHMFDGGEGMGMWFRKESALPGGGKSKFYRGEGYELSGLMCTNMRGQCKINGLTA